MVVKTVLIMVSLVARQTIVQTSLIMVSDMTVETMAEMARDRYFIMVWTMPQKMVLEMMEGMTPILESSVRHQALTPGY